MCTYGKEQQVLLPFSISHDSYNKKNLVKWELKIHIQVPHCDTVHLQSLPSLLQLMTKFIMCLPT